MMTKTQTNALFRFKDKDLAHMANEVGDCVEAKKDIFIDLGEGAEEIDDVLYDDYNKKATFFYKFGADRRSITLWESDNPTFHFNATLGFYKLNPIRPEYPSSMVPSSDSRINMGMLRYLPPPLRQSSGSSRWEMRPSTTSSMFGR